MHGQSVMLWICAGTGILGVVPAAGFLPGREHAEAGQPPADKTQPTEDHA